MGINLLSGRHSGLLIPLFSMPSTASWGIGEILDIPLVGAWLRSAGQDLLQVLPLNEMAPGQTSPYSAITAMAFDPVFISLRGSEDFAAAGGEAALTPEAREALDEARRAPRVQYGTVRVPKREALRLAFDQFTRSEASPTQRSAAFEAYVEAERWWLDDYALFRALHAAMEEKSWTEWPDPLKSRERAATGAARRDIGREVRYQQYLQWLADQQWRYAREHAGVALVGDLPFMVDFDSADVWAHQDLFDLHASVGVPPDAFSETGQNWGLPAYRWDVMAKRGDQWLHDRARRSAALYDAYRIDHLVGFYRTYTIPHGGGAPRFVPGRRPAQLAQGERVLEVFRGKEAGVIAEDLGLVPDFVRSSLARLGIPGYRVLRWEREWKQPGQPFRDPVDYPPTSVATSGTHDTEPLAVWWQSAGKDERAKVAGIATLRSIAGAIDIEATDFTPALRDSLVELLFASGSGLLILPVQDVFGWPDRINVPASVADTNWTWRLPWPVDRLDEEPEARECAGRLREWARRHGRG
jgi:4-alpha-glucanotransferase